MLRECPEKYEDLAKRCMELFGLDDWKVWVREMEEPSDGDYNATCFTDGRYKRAYIDIKRDLTDETATMGVQHTVIHEFAHALLGTIDHLVQQRMIPNLPKNMQEVMSDLYVDAVEQTVEQLSGGIRRAMQVQL